MRLGVDLGGTKTEIIALDDRGRELLRRSACPRCADYDGTLAAISDLVAGAEAELGEKGSVGVAIPGTVSRLTGLDKNANSTWLNGKPFARDLEASARTGPIRLANDANCFALSEATDGAGTGSKSVFGVILGTGTGRRRGGGWPGAGRRPRHRRRMGPQSPARHDQGRMDGSWALLLRGRGCIEQWLSGPGLAAEFKRQTGLDWTAEKIAASGDAASPRRHARAGWSGWAARWLR